MFTAMTPMTVRLTVSQILDKQGMSTGVFAKRAKLTYNQALAIRRGAYTRLDLDTIGRVCDALGVQPGELFTTEETETH